MCNCSGGFSGPNCESECIVKSIYRVGLALIMPIIYIHTRAYIKCARASLRCRAHNDILLDVTAHVCIIIP